MCAVYTRGSTNIRENVCYSFSLEYANNFFHEKKTMEVETCLKLRVVAISDAKKSEYDEDDEINNGSTTTATINSNNVTAQMFGNTEFRPEPKRKQPQRKYRQFWPFCSTRITVYDGASTRAAFDLLSESRSRTNRNVRSISERVEIIVAFYV